MVGTLVRVLRYASSWSGYAKVCSLGIFETSFFYDKDIWIAATDYYVYFYIVVLFPLKAILQLMNFTVFYPTALKGCLGIVLNHGVGMGRRAGKSKSGLYLRNYKV